jgi:hypothetical protein
MRFKHFYPLLAFLIPTALIGYGVVIPRSAIAGVNGLTIGFGSALLGAAIAYWQGIRMALRRKRNSGRENMRPVCHRIRGESVAGGT